MDVASRLGQPVTMDRCIDEWKTLSEEYEECMIKHKEYQEANMKYHKLQKDTNTAVARQLKKIKSLKKTLKHVPGSDGKSDIINEIEQRQRELDETQKYLPKPNGFYLRLIVGEVNMVFSSKAEKFKYKDGYEMFKLKCSFILLIYSTLLLTKLDSKVFDVLYSFMLLWYYCTLTVRESILIANGSRIKGWWVTHHYVSVILSGINVVWPHGGTYTEFRDCFMQFSMYQSFVQLLQYYYQSGCLYRLRALGERHDMDITVEGFSSWMWRGLKFLLPFLFIGQFWELYNSYILMQIATRHQYNEWQVPALAICFFILFTGNFYTTLVVVLQKKKAMDRRKTK